MNYWLLKSEPDSFSIDALGKAPNQTTAWDGVRNFQARNMLRDSMKKGDLAFFYHSSCDVPGIAGIVSVVREGYPDVTAFDPKHHHYDADSKKEAPRWFVVDLKLKRKLKRVVTLDELRKYADKKLKDFVLLRRGNRLSVMPVSKQDWDFVLGLE
ncbi:MAG TPA: EVE domain-containing protein [Steroidobacteraceae bacterium]|jgi:predicted RNA-binding protein with PUA-like domain|nr:EVE domain-containing protein [Steroidobacteraceae bacterium]